VKADKPGHARNKYGHQRKSRARSQLTDRTKDMSNHAALQS